MPLYFLSKYFISKSSPEYKSLFGEYKILMILSLPLKYGNFVPKNLAINLNILKI